jgi:predicted double-glycine peptidase
MSFRSGRPRAASRAAAATFLAAASAAVVAFFGGAGRDHAIERGLAGARGARFVERGSGVRQRFRNDCGPAALAHALRLLGEEVPYPDPNTTIRLSPRGSGFLDLTREARRWGRRAEGRIIEPHRLQKVRPPAILFLHEGPLRDGHFVVLEGWSENGEAVLHDPALGRLSITPASLAAHWRGETLVFETAGPEPDASDPHHGDDEASIPGLVVEIDEDDLLPRAEHEAPAGRRNGE